MGAPWAPKKNWGTGPTLHFYIKNTIIYINNDSFYIKNSIFYIKNTIFLYKK